jgi:arginyl-tRNA synthetase
MAFLRHKSSRTEYRALLHVLNSFSNKTFLHFYLKYSAARKNNIFRLCDEDRFVYNANKKISFYAHNQTRITKTLLVKMGFIGG